MVVEVQSAVVVGRMLAVAVLLGVSGCVLSPVVSVTVCDTYADCPTQSGKTKRWLSGPEDLVPQGPSRIGESGGARPEGEAPSFLSETE